MKRILLIAILCLVGYFAKAKAPIIEEIESRGLITVNVPAELENVLLFNQQAAASSHHSEEEVEEAPTQRVGYRIQVFDDNNPRTAKAQAEERKRMIENKFPEFRAYTTFNSPYWRVKVGDFRTRSEAEAALGAIRSAFPSLGSQLRVVRDKINPR